MSTYAVIGTLAVVLIALGGFGWWRHGRQSRKLGAAQARADGLEAGVDAARKGQEIDEDVSKLSDSDLYDELRNGGKQ